MNAATVALIGRPNVGKSTLFNRIAGGRSAIVDDRPGSTRDRHFGKAEWNGRAFWLVDTGGLLPTSDEPMDAAIRNQVEMAVAAADVVLLLTEVEVGPAPADQEIAQYLRGKGKPVILVVNKADALARETRHLDFYELGLGDPVAVSAGSVSVTSRSRSVALSASRALSARNSTLPRIGMVLRRSTTRWTWPSDFRSCARSTVTFILISARSSKACHGNAGRLFERRGRWLPASRSRGLSGARKVARMGRKFKGPLARFQGFGPWNAQFPPRKKRPLPRLSTGEGARSHSGKKPVKLRERAPIPEAGA